MHTCLFLEAQVIFGTASAGGASKNLVRFTCKQHVTSSFSNTRVGGGYLPEVALPRALVSGALMKYRLKSPLGQLELCSLLNV